MAETHTDRPHLAIYQQPDFPAALKWQAIGFMKVEWPFIFSGDLEFLSDPYPADLNPVHFALAKGESLISYASAFRLSVPHAGEEYEVYGFGNMFTFPPYLKQGYGRQVVESATDHIRQSDVDVAILFCDPQLEAFYAPCGWEVTHSPTRLGTPRDYRVLDSLRMMLFISEKGRQGRHDFDVQPLYIPWHW